MVKCPFCQFANEDGALFCEQCKSDLGIVEAAAIPMAQPLVAEPTVPIYSRTVPLPPPGILAPPPATPAADASPAAMETMKGGYISATAEFQGIPVDTGTPLGVGTATLAPVPTQPAPDAPAATPAATSAPPPPAPLLAGATPKLVVLRGVKLNVEYPIYEGLNFVGRADEKPVDIDLEDQEPPDRIWSSRQHACINFENGILSVEDLNSSNGTFVNRTRVYPGQKRPLGVGDVIQIGTVQMKVKV